MARIANRSPAAHKELTRLLDAPLHCPEHPERLECRGLEDGSRFRARQDLLHSRDRLWNRRRAENQGAENPTLEISCETDRSCCSRVAQALLPALPRLGSLAGGPTVESHVAPLAREPEVVARILEH